MCREAAERKREDGRGRADVVIISNENKRIVISIENGNTIIEYQWSYLFVILVRTYSPVTQF